MNENNERLDAIPLLLPSAVMNVACVGSSFSSLEHFCINFDRVMKVNGEAWVLLGIGIVDRLSFVHVLRTSRISLLKGYPNLKP